MFCIVDAVVQYYFTSSLIYLAANIKTIAGMLLWRDVQQKVGKVVARWD